MLEKILLLATLLSSVNCGSNILPLFDPTKKVWDCTEIPSDQTCLITFVVYPLTTMTSYNFTNDSQPLRGYRAVFNSNSDLVNLTSDEVISAIPPTIFIQADGHFRSVITVNGQMPGPTIIAHANQKLNITVFNELRDADAGISIHWHGLDQAGTPEADGVAYITQLPILPNQNYTYSFRAHPAGTYWYHSHAGAQRSDGLYGALIINDTIPGYTQCVDSPDVHTLLLMDWQEKSSDDLFRSFNNGLGYWKQSADGSYTEYVSTLGLDNVGVGPMPFWSGIINDKGRHYNESGQTNIRHNRLNYFNVTQGNCYRFRLIGSQALFGLKVSIQDHKMTVVATDGLPIVPIEDVDSVIINPGERYDVIVNATNALKNYWIWAETLEDENLSTQIFYSPVSKHRAEAILHYNDVDDNIDDISEIKSCTSTFKCKVVNCPYSTTDSDELNINCTNAGDFESPESVPESIRNAPDRTLFYNFGFDGELTTEGSSIDGIDFQLPANPPLTENAAFNNSGNMCPHRGCDHEIKDNCACTQVIDIGDMPRGSVVELVLSNRLVDPHSPGGASHPIHLHGHDFYVIKQAYPMYNSNGTFGTANDDIECINSNNQTCPKYFITEQDQIEPNQALRWRNNMGPDIQSRNFSLKDTVIVPFGGYTIIRFEVNNPGWWFIHCHIEIHQLNGMVAVVRELPAELPKSLTEPSPTILPISPCSSLQLQSSSLMMIIVLITAITFTYM